MEFETGRIFKAWFLRFRKPRRCFASRLQGVALKARLVGLRGPALA